MCTFRPTQPSILPGSANEDQLQLRRKGWLPHLSALEVRSRQSAIQIHVYLYLYLYTHYSDKGSLLASDQSNWFGPQVHLHAAIIYTHQYHLLLFNQKVDIHFTILQTVKGWVNPVTAINVCSRCKGCASQCFFRINTQTHHGWIWTCEFTHRS